MAQPVQAATGHSVEVGYVDQGYTGQRSAEAAQAHGIALEVIKLSEAKRGFVLLPRRWVVERSFAWAARFRRLARDYDACQQHWPACTWWPSPPLGSPKRLPCSTWSVTPSREERPRRAIRIYARCVPAEVGGRAHGCWMVRI